MTVSLDAGTFANAMAFSVTRLDPQQSLARGNRQAAANQRTAFVTEMRALKRSHILAAGQADLCLFEVDNILPTMPLAAFRNQQVTRCIRTH